MEFDNPEEILEILLCSDKSYEELIEYCKNLYPQIKQLHKNSIGNEYSSIYTQCILECYKIKNNFSSNIWHSIKKVHPDMLNTNDNIKYTNLTNTLSKLDTVIENFEIEIYSSGFIAEVLNIKDKKGNTCLY